MEENFTLRRAKITDVKKLSILFKTVYIETYGTEGVSDEFANFITRQFAETRLEELISVNAENLIVAEFKGNLVGVAELEFGKQSPVPDIFGVELNKLYILKRFCGKGIGKRLITACEDLLRSQGEKRMWLWVLISNHGAISFYESNGYQTQGIANFQMEKNTYVNKVMVKDL